VKKRKTRRRATDVGYVLDALAAVEDAVVVVDGEVRLVYANPSAVALFGPGALSGEPSRWVEEHGLYRADGTTPFVAEALPMRRALEGHTSRDVAMVVKNARRPQGVQLLVCCAPIADRDAGGAWGAAYLLHEVTPAAVDAWLAAVGPLRARVVLEAEQQRKAILDNIRDMAWLKDAAGRFVAVNQASVDMYRRPLEAWIGATDYDVYPREVAERFRADDAEVMKLGAQRCVEEKIVDSDGREHWLETIKAPVFGEGGEIIGTTGTARDITERKRVAEQLRSANDELERRVTERTRALAEAQQALVRRERLAVLGSLAGGVAHQLRNPLGAIMNATAIITHHLRSSPSPEVAEAIRVTQEEIRHADSIIRGLLEYARVRTPNRQPTSIAELIEGVLRSQAIPERVEVRREIHYDAELLVDADQIHSALSNLVLNALDAMPDGGALVVEVTADAERVTIAVEDTGAGAGRVLGERLFEPLLTTASEGMGLGLPTARAFVEAHGGTLVSVAVPSGARFEIRLPLRDSIEPAR
jgi:PAS domain S-box-containing protein